jgi:hypothetical protein
MLFTASADKRSAVALMGDPADRAMEPSLFRRKMESAGMLPAVPQVSNGGGNGGSKGGSNGSRGDAGRGYVLPSSPSIRQYLFHLTADARRVNETEVRSAVVGVTPVEIERVARAVAKLRGRYLAQVVDTGATAQGPLTSGEVEQLRQARENYEELEAGFAALRAAIESGEVPLEGVRRD